MKKLGVLGVLLFMTGCAHLSVKNTTPSTVPVNASGVYPITMETIVRSGDVVHETIHPTVVVDGKKRPMKSLKNDQYIYQYRIPRDQNSASYYFDVDYTLQGNSGIRHLNVKSPVYELKLANRYAVGIDSHRGVPGSHINIIGKGFTEKDQVRVGDQVADSQFVSSSSIQFILPAVSAEEYHEVVIFDEDGNEINAGKIFMDAGTITTSPSLIQLRQNESTNVTFTISFPAPKGGLDLDITTNIPDSISMPDVRVRQGRTSATVTIEGNEVGQGALFIQAEGYGQIAIPVIVLP